MPKNLDQAQQEELLRLRDEHQAQQEELTMLREANATLRRQLKGIKKENNAAAVLRPGWFKVAVVIPAYSAADATVKINEALRKSRINHELDLQVQDLGTTRAHDEKQTAPNGARWYSRGNSVTSGPFLTQEKAIESLRLVTGGKGIQSHFPTDSFVWFE